MIAYLMQEYGYNMFQALSYVKTKRSVVYPNPGFQRQLLDYEKKLIQQKKTNLEIIASIPGQSKMSQAYSSNGTAIRNRASTTASRVTMQKQDHGYKNKQI